MNINDEFIRKAVSAIQSASSDKKISTKFYGTVSVDSETDKKYVILDGSDQKTAIVEGTEVMDGDRVLVSLENHQAVVISNITSPASARTATNFMDFKEDEGGLIIGELLDNENEFNVLIKPDGLYIRNGYGDNAVILAVYDENGVSLCDEEGTPVAKFYENGIVFNPDDSNCETRISNGGFIMKYKNGNSYRYHKLNSNGFWLNNPSTVYNHPIGYTINADCNDITVALSRQAWTHTVGRLSLPFGVWLITFGGAFSGVNGGTRQLVLTTDAASTPSPTRQDIILPATTSDPIRSIHTRIVSVSDSVIYYLHAYSGATSNVTLYPFIRAVRIA